MLPTAALARALVSFCSPVLGWSTVAEEDMLRVAKRGACFCDSVTPGVLSSHLEVCSIYPRGLCSIPVGWEWWLGMWLGEDKIPQVHRLDLVQVLKLQSQALCNLI